MGLTRWCTAPRRPTSRSSTSPSTGRPVGRPRGPRRLSPGGCGIPASSVCSTSSRPALPWCSCSNGHTAVRWPTCYAVVTGCPRRKSSPACRRSPKRFATRTPAGSCTATSAQRTSCSPRTDIPSWPTSGSPASLRGRIVGSRPWARPRTSIRRSPPGASARRRVTSSRWRPSVCMPRPAAARGSATRPTPSTSCCGGLPAPSSPIWMRGSATVRRPWAPCSAGRWMSHRPDGDRPVTSASGCEERPPRVAMPPPVSQ